MDERPQDEVQRRKSERARIRRARGAQRKLKKARTELESLGEITPWEDEFIASVDERLDKYDAAFADPSLGGFDQALSNRQLQVLAQMRKKIRDCKTGKMRDKARQSPKSGQKLGWRSSFKNKSGFKPRVRHIEDELPKNKVENPKPEKNSPPQNSRPKLTIIDGGKK